MYIFALFVFYIFYVMQEKRQEILLFILKQSLILSNVCVIVGTRTIGDSITGGDLIRFNITTYLD